MKLATSAAKVYQCPTEVMSHPTSTWHDSLCSLCSLSSAKDRAEIPLVKGEESHQVT